jgi:hypothetical protein
MCLKVWKGGFESNNSNKMVARGAVVTTNITHAVRVVDARKMVKSQYEATVILLLLVTFVTFVAFSPHPTISKE